jgi:hypothetical protein
MGHAMLFASVIALVALAFGKDAAVILARILVIGIPLVIAVLLLCANAGVFKGL